ncbi:NADH:flavin oxidoreductase [Bradyrhizobium cenepequi]|uniref:NADH:flavin oxidoreductase n=1 Tax=Bradyrhizobium cenepequi TaxID=2821403 RepID=UPI001CE29256|nr:NADH:flavin oxidoreductase [Bradyrhizobium cenepequi]MCA6110150.1 NADH:flavin oxidoreductase [Bradyrhizobium cenepequi]
MNSSASVPRSDRTAFPQLFSPLAIGSLELPNRLAVAPMTRVSAEADGRATPRMVGYYSSFAAGGFGLIVTEGIYTDKAFSQGYLFQPGLTDARQSDAWRAVVDAVHERGGRILAQLMHAGALSQGNPHREGTVGPSAVRPKGQQMEFYRGSGEYAVPRAITAPDIAEAKDGFVQAARYARDAGFDGIEIHGANGYLLDQFLSERINGRDDRYGGAVENRLRLTKEIVQAVRYAVGNDMVIGVRISQGKVNDCFHKWRGPEEAAEIFSALGRLPLDYIHTTEFEAWKSAFGDGASLASYAKAHSGRPVIANGSLHDPLAAAGLIERGEADLVSLGRGALTHADWPLRVLSGTSIAEFDRRILAPLADLENADRLREEILAAQSVAGV